MTEHTGPGSGDPLARREYRAKPDILLSPASCLLSPPVVYAHPNGADYVAEVDGRWLRWPAVSCGWEQRQPCGPAEAEWDELPADLARLALRLSGAPE